MMIADIKDFDKRPSVQILAVETTDSEEAAASLSEEKESSSESCAKPVGEFTRYM